MHLKKLILDTFFAERKKLFGNRQLKENWNVKVVEVVRRLETAERFPSIHIHIWSEPAPGSFISFSSSVRTAPQFIHLFFLIGPNSSAVRSSLFPHRFEPVTGSFISPFPRHSSLLHIITIPIVSPSSYLSVSCSYFSSCIFFVLFFILSSQK